MPPKRKASEHTDAPPATKRTLRSTAAVAAPVATLPTRRSTRGCKGESSDTDEGVEENAGHVEPVAPTTRKRRTTVKPSAIPTAQDVPEASSSRVQLPDPITTTRRGNLAYVEEESDELLLTVARKRAVRPVTPPRTTATRVGTPRTVLECVEIVTPSRRFLAGSPVSRSGRTQPGGQRALDALNRATSPSPSKRPARVASPTKQRPAQPARSRSSSPDALLLQRGRHAKPVTSPPPPSRRSQTLTTPASSPSKRQGRADAQEAPTRDPGPLPPHLHTCLRAQQRAILKSLRHIPDTADDHDADDVGPSTNTMAFEQLRDLLNGTVTRGEGNSCLLIGPRGSGKTRLVEQAIAAQPERPIIVRLSGHAQQNDRLAIREIARQLTQQTGSSFLLEEDEDKPANDPFTDPENPFLDTSDPDPAPAIALPAPAHLLALISMIPTLPRATVVVIDAFDKFATHARQSLLYCLLDTVQSCRAGKGNKGLAVIGVTTRVDTINLLEKRVKSRFSGRILRTACPGRLQYWIDVARTILTAPIDVDASDEWPTRWATSVEDFLRQDTVTESLRVSYALTRDVDTLRRMLTLSVLELSPTAPSLSVSRFAATIVAQRCPSRFPFLDTLPYPAICLLIAATHAQTSGHDHFTFEMLHEAFRDQVRTSQSAPVQFEGGSIGMVRCSREVLIGAFERLVSIRVFVAVVPPSISTTREFVLHRCAVDRFEVKKAVEAIGQTSLKKWFSKA